MKGIQMEGNGEYNNAHQSSAQSQKNEWAWNVYDIKELGEISTYKLKKYIIEYGLTIPKSNQNPNQGPNRNVTVTFQSNIYVDNGTDIKYVMEQLPCWNILRAEREFGGYIGNNDTIKKIMSTRHPKQEKTSSFNQKDGNKLIYKIGSIEICCDGKKYNVQTIKLFDKDQTQDTGKVLYGNIDFLKLNTNQDLTSQKPYTEIYAKTVLEGLLRKDRINRESGYIGYTDGVKKFLDIDVRKTLEVLHQEYCKKFQRGTYSQEECRVAQKGVDIHTANNAFKQMEGQQYRKQGPIQSY